jgi:hypothetical protein
MSVLTRLTEALTGSSTQTAITELREDLANERNQTAFLEESLADLELALQDRGWTHLTHGQNLEFSPAGRKNLVDICRAMTVSNPLAKRGAGLRVGYVWGKGVEISARDEDVNTLLQAFMEANQKVLFGSRAHEENEKGLYADGELFFALFTDPLTGMVQVRSLDAVEVTDVITNPEDRDEVWYYLRRYNAVVAQHVYPDGTSYDETRQGKVVAYPAVGYRPQTRRRYLGDPGNPDGGGIEIMWDAPVIHVPVNRLNGWLRGVPDVYAAIAFARAYKEYLGDWAMVMKSLSKFTWRLTGDTKTRAQKAAEKVTANATVPPLNGPNPAAGQVAASGPGLALEAIPKSGATLDADSGRPLAAMVAAALGVPVTMLLTDPGVTGARATAETLDQPMVLETGMRRMLWSSVFDEICQYVIDAAVIAPRGPLQGSLSRDEWGRLKVELGNEQDRTVEVVWPDITDTPIDLAVAAIVDAAGLGLIPDIEVVKLLLHALGVRDVDEIIEANTDADGNWTYHSQTKANAGQAAIDAARAGTDPAAAYQQ